MGFKICIKNTFEHEHTFDLLHLKKSKALKTIAFGFQNMYEKFNINIRLMSDISINQNPQNITLGLKKLHQILDIGVHLT